MEFDVVIVGAGPAGLAAAIRLKQLAAEAGERISVVVLEKGSEVGAHILSGAVIDPIGLDRCFPTGRPRARRSRRRSPRTAFYSWPGGRRAPAELPDAAADEQPRQLHRLPRQRRRWLGEQARRWASRSIRASPPPRCCMTRTARCAASPPATWASARRRAARPSFTRGMELRGKYVLHRRRRARLARQAADRADSGSTRVASRRNTASA